MNDRPVQALLSPAQVRSDVRRALAQLGAHR
jgi:hypothetical protein